MEIGKGISYRRRRQGVIPADQSTIKIRETVFSNDDFFDKGRVIKKNRRVDLCLGTGIDSKGVYRKKMPLSDDEWLAFLDMDIYWGDLKDQWEHYIVGCLIFFALLRSDIKRDFLLQPDNIRGQRPSRWLGILQHYMNALLKNVVTEVCLCYSMILEKRPIKVKYSEIAG
jgi:hypothetical protein